MARLVEFHQAPGFDRTYEGLKRVVAEDVGADAGQVLTVPMRV